MATAAISVDRQLRMNKSTTIPASKPPSTKCSWTARKDSSMKND